MSHIEKTAHRFAAVVAVIQRALIHVHADKLIRELGIEIARKLHGVSERLFAMADGVLDALMQRVCDAGHRFATERAADGIPAERSPAAGFFLPPSTEVDHAVQAGFVVRELALMNDEAGFVLPFENLRNDLIERNNLHLNTGREQLKSQVRSG